LWRHALEEEWLELTAVFLDQSRDLLEDGGTAAVLEATRRASFHDADALIDPWSGLGVDFLVLAEPRTKFSRVQKDDDRSHVSHEHAEPLEGERLSGAKSRERRGSRFSARHSLEHAAEICEFLFLRCSERVGWRLRGTARRLLDWRPLCWSLFGLLLWGRSRLGYEYGAASDVRGGGVGEQHGTLGENPERGCRDQRTI
jgi:hypothetical protein